MNQIFLELFGAENEWQPVVIDQMDAAFIAPDMVVTLLMLDDETAKQRWINAQVELSAWRRENKISNTIDMYMLLIVDGSPPWLDQLNEAANDRSVCRKIVIVKGNRSLKDALQQDFTPCRAVRDAITTTMPELTTESFLELLRTTPADVIAHEKLQEALLRT